MNCQKCGECCQRVMFPVVDYDHTNWLKLHGITVMERAGWEYAVFDIPCQNYDGVGCSDYENRPEMCKRYQCLKMQSDK